MSAEGESVVLDLSVTETFTLGEWADIEEASGHTIIGVDLRRPPMWLLAGYLWIVRRRDDPLATYDDARGVRFMAMRIGGPAEGAGNPTAAAGGA